MSTTTSEETKKESIGRAIGRITSGVYIVTVDDGGTRDGMLATWVIQSAFEPPMLSLAVKKERPVLAHLQSGKHFAVNVLSKKNMEIFKHFAKPFTEGMDRFEGLEVDTKVSVAPVFPASVAFMSCTVRGSVDAGDHIVIVAEITDGAVLNADDEPMSHLRKNGFQY